LRAKKQVRKLCNESVYAKKKKKYTKKKQKNGCLILLCSHSHIKAHERV